jgi:hypothetical protein
MDRRHKLSGFNEKDEHDSAGRSEKETNQIMNKNEDNEN